MTTREMRALRQRIRARALWWDELINDILWTEVFFLALLDIAPYFQP